MKARTASRIGAFVVDCFIVAVIITLLTGFLPTSKKYDEAYDKQNEIIESVVKGEKELDEIYDDLYETRYTLDRESIHITLVSALVYLGYFGTFAFYKNGQTLGKKLAHIKIEAKNNTNLTFILRAALIHGVYVSLLTVIGVLLLDKTSYATFYALLSIINFIILFISLICVAVRQDGKGIHDLLFKTSVIKE